MHTLDQTDLNAIVATLADSLETGANGGDTIKEFIASAVIAQMNATPPNVVATNALTIIPSVASVADRAGTNYILAYTSETNSISVTVLDSAGDAVDLSAKTLGVYWETDAKVSIASLTSGVTVSGAGNNVVTFAIPSAVTSEERELIFAIRDQAAPKALYAGGVFDVKYLPAG